MPLVHRMEDRALADLDERRARARESGEPTKDDERLATG
jgi:hypothetical protein